MKFFTDENVATSVVSALRRYGHEVKDIKEEKLQGTSDKKDHVEYIRLKADKDKGILSLRGYKER